MPWRHPLKPVEANPRDSVRRTWERPRAGQLGPTVYEWLDGGEPTPDHLSRLQTLLRLLAESRVSANRPLFPRFVRSAVGPGDRSLLDLLGEETIDEIPARDALRKAKALGDAIHALREQRASRQREAGFEEPDAEQRTRFPSTRRFTKDTMRV